MWKTYRMGGGEEMREKIKEIIHKLKTLPEGYLLSSPFNDDGNDKSGHLHDVEEVERYVEALEDAKEREGKCRWVGNKRGHLVSCHQSYWGTGATEGFVVCPYCTKKIEWVEGKK